jgi:hypothetical protein
MSKKKIYFDNNIYADIIRRNIAVEVIKSIINKNRLILTISSLNLLEAASCWKSGNPQSISEAIKRFQLFKELLPCRFLKEVAEISLGEIKKALENKTFDIFYDGTEAETEINKLAQGVYDDTASKFIEKQWDSKILEIQRRVEYLNKAENLPPAVNFHQFSSYYQQFFAEHFIAEKVKGIPSKEKRKLAQKMLLKAHKYPLINSMVNANLFLDFRLLKFKSISHDTLDDMKHLIIASHCAIFVTNDRKIHENFHYINPYIKMMYLKDFLNLKR